MDYDYIIAQNDFLPLVKQAVADLSKGKGSVIAVAGEAGMGKTHLLKYYNEKCEQLGEFIHYYIESQAPIGNFKISKIQPLLPFARAIEYILAKKNISAEKKFMVNVGMTVLASIPIAGDAFYAVKELARDWRQFKTDKNSDERKNASKAALDYFDTLSSISSKTPLILFFDDFHWSDAQSVELLNLISDSIDELPIIIVLSYRSSIVEASALPLYSFTHNRLENDKKLKSFQLETFDRLNIREAAKYTVNNYKNNSEFEEWIFNNSFGIPGVVIEYLKYFNKNSPFNSDGTLIESFLDNKLLPTSVQSVFSQAIEQLNEEEKNILSVCSSEGKEFTISIVADLLNTDVLTAIKKLRSIQNKTGVIRSVGARTRYGVKTTVYEFTQAFYHTFFENSLEYEENQALHSRISELLQQKYDNARTESIRRQIAPYLAAHSSEAGDTEKAKNMLFISAQAAEENGSHEVMENTYQSFMDLSDMENAEINPQNIAFQKLLNNVAHQNNNNIQNNGTADNKENETFLQNQVIEFKTIRRSIVEDFHSANYSIAVEKATTYFDTYSAELNQVEKAQILALAIRCYVELNDFESAKKYIKAAELMLEDEKEPIAECFLLNSLAVLYYSQNNIDMSEALLKRAAKRVNLLPIEMKLLTLTNIANFVEKRSPEKADKYYTLVKKISKELNFTSFADSALN